MGGVTTPGVGYVSVTKTGISLTTAGLGTGGSNNVYTVPSGKTFILIQASIITTAFATANATKATWEIESGGVLIGGPTTFAVAQEIVGKGRSVSGSGPATTGITSASGVIRVNVTVASLAATHTGTAVIFGILYS